MDIGRLRRFRSLHITRRDFVVEVGSGNDPYWRSNLLIDKHVTDSAERPGGYMPLIIDRPFVVGDALHLPLQDRSVDFLVARNILEHIVDVDAFIGEMMRVSRRGYIATPSILSEKLFGWTKHVWFVSIDNGILKLRPKESPLHDPDLSKLFHPLYERNRSFRRFYKKNRKLFVVEYYWEGRIHYHAESNLDNLSKIKTTRAQFDFEGIRSALVRRRQNVSLRQHIESAARRFLSKTEIARATDVVNRLACPICIGPLIVAKEGRVLACTKCTARYPVIEEVPILVREAAGRI